MPLPPLLLAVLLVGWQSPAAAAPTPPRTAVVTAYCARCSGPTGCRDNALQVGDCAADPTYHPYGSQIWLQGFGVLTVRDRGRKIRGPARFDVYLGGPKQCSCDGTVGRVRRRYRVVAGR